MCRFIEAVLSFLAQCVIYYLCCVVSGLKDRVRRPRSSRLVHRIDAVSPQSTTQISVPLILSRTDSRRNSPVHMTHSVSTPVLQGAWSMRNLEHAVPPLDTARHAGTFALVLNTVTDLEPFSQYFSCCSDASVVISLLLILRNEK